MDSTARVTISLGGATLGRVRMAGSPLREALNSLSLWLRHRDEAPWPYTAWARSVTARLAAEPSNYAVSLVAGMADSSPPSFLTPIPEPGVTLFHQQLDQLSRIRPSVIRAQLREQYGECLPAELARFDREPGGAMAAFIEGLSAYWNAALAPYWPMVRSAVDAELLFRAQSLAARGTQAMLEGLHRRVECDGSVLRLMGAPTRRITLDGDWLVVVPMIFARRAPIVSVENGAAAFSYQARGAATLSFEPVDGPRTGDRLSILLGESRATLMRALSEPTTTTTLATTLGLAPSTVSEHLRSLMAADVLSRQRAGGKVLYAVNAVGRAIIDQLQSTHPGT